MGQCKMVYREIRFILEEELTQVYVAIEAQGDCPLGIQGWHHRTFPATRSALDVLEAMKHGAEDPVLWPQEAPPAGGTEMVSLEAMRPLPRETPAETRARHRASWERLSPELRARAVRIFEEWCDSTNRAWIRESALANPLWWVESHLSAGMGFRNYLRDQGILDDQLPGTFYAVEGADPDDPETWPKNWDDYYVAVIEGAVGIYDGFVPVPGSCSVCGCDQQHACSSGTGEPCSWANAGRTLCSACAEALEVRSPEGDPGQG